MTAAELLPGVDDARYPCVSASRTLSGAASLASVSAFHGVPFEVRELARLVAPVSLDDLDEGTLLAVARSIGFEVVPLEGGYENLPEVPLPMLVVLRDPKGRRYGVLYAVDEARVTLADPTAGTVAAVDRDPFCASWTGEVVQIGALEAERRAFLARLQEVRDPTRRLLRALGWGPPFWRRWLWLAGTTVAGAVALALPWGNAWDRAVSAALAGAFALSLWSWLMSDACVSCRQATVTAGPLPLAQVGSGLYAALLLAPETAVPPAAICLVLSGAFGAHAVLIGRLAREKLRCVACLLVAACVGFALVTSVLRGGSSLAGCVAIALLAAAAMELALRVGLARQRRAFEAVARALARRVREEPRDKEAPPVRVVAFKKGGCSACALYDAVVRPGLAAEFGESIGLEERDLGDARTTAPVVVVLGGQDTVFVGLPAGEPYAHIQRAVQDALRTAAPGSAQQLRMVQASTRS